MDESAEGESEREKVSRCRLSAARARSIHRGPAFPREQRGHSTDGLGTGERGGGDGETVGWAERMIEFSIGSINVCVCV